MLQQASGETGSNRVTVPGLAADSANGTPSSPTAPGPSPGASPSAGAGSPQLPGDWPPFIPGQAPSPGGTGTPTPTPTATSTPTATATPSNTPTAPANQAPSVNAGTDQALTLPAGALLAGSVADDGRPNPPGVVTLTWSKTSGPGTVTFGTPSAESTTAAFSSSGAYVLRLTASDGALTTFDELTVTVTDAPPPGPVLIASALTNAAPSHFANATAFLYTGSDPVQTGVAPGTIKEYRAAVIRGRVLNRAGAPLPEVAVSILGRSEFGGTQSRADGWYDIAVNGGSALTVVYTKAGFLPAQRRVEAPWLDYEYIPDVVLIPQDTVSTTVTMGAAAMQAATSSAVTDARGTRSAVLLVPPGTTASLVLPGGGTIPAPVLTVRQTEFTAGASGRAAMPAELPPTSAFTYAVDLSADEAGAAGATSVTFSQPLIQYVDNFLGAPVGTGVPAGFYDQAKGVWVPSPDGRVIKILSETGGMADLDVTGDGVADTGAALTALGITDAERERLALLYEPGKELWRVKVPHFSWWDYNWPWGFPSVIASFKDAKVTPLKTRPLSTRNCRPCPGSEIELENQVLGETVGLTGVPFALHYSSARMAGSAQSDLEITVFPFDSVPSLLRVEVNVIAAGQHTNQTFPYDSNSFIPLMKWTYHWNGRDGYNRVMTGAHAAKVRICNVYSAVYYRSRADFEASFAQTGATLGGTMVMGWGDVEVRDCREFHETVVAPWDVGGAGLGGWSLSPHHIYDPAGKTLYLGTGERIHDVDALGDIIENAAGCYGPEGVCPTNWTVGPEDDGVSANSLKINNPLVVRTAPDGDVYTLTDDGLIWRIDRDGLIWRVAGTRPGSGVETGPALDVQIVHPTDFDIAPDGTIYYAGLRRIYKLSGGQVTVFAGTGNCGGGPAGDGGSALLADICENIKLALAPDGAMFVADQSNRLVRRIGTDGVIRTFAGVTAATCLTFMWNGGFCVGYSTPWGDSGWGLQAQDVSFSSIESIDVGPDGSVYVAAAALGRFRPDGELEKVGGFTSGGSGGTEATGVPFALESSPIYRAMVTADGAIYYRSEGWPTPTGGGRRIRRATVGGRTFNVAGDGQDGCCGLGNGGTATAAPLNHIYSIALSPDGMLYAAEWGGVVRRVRSRLHGFGDLGDIFIPSPDGSVVWRFDGSGRHLSTLHALTGQPLVSFTYDSGGRLASVVEHTGGTNNVTTIQRDAIGNPTGITGPFGQQTALTVDANAYLESITSPLGGVVALDTNASGLLTAMTTPRGHSYAYAYEPSSGYLTSDTDPAGGSQTLARTELLPNASIDGGRSIVRTTVPLGRATTGLLEFPVNGDRHQRVTDADGTWTDTMTKSNGTEVTTDSTGVTSTTALGPDPRFSMFSPIMASASLENTSGGLTMTASSTRAVVLSVPTDIFSLVSVTDTATVNGKTTTSVYDGATRTFTSTSPFGRSGTVTIDAFGRPTASTTPGLAATSATYDVRGRLETMTAGTGGGARTTSFAYNSAGLVATITDPLGRAVSFEYDAAGRVTKQTLPGGSFVLFGYDANGNLTSLTPPGKPAHTFAYNSVDSVTQYSPPDIGLPEERTLYTYNTDRQLLTETRPDGVVTTLTYDAAGRLSTMTFQSKTITLGYNVTTGLLTSITGPYGVNLAYTYTGALMTAETWSGDVAGSVGYTYDNDFRVIGQTVNGANSAAFTYDLDSLLTGAGAMTLTRNASNGLLTGTTLAAITDALTYNLFGEPLTYSAANSGTPFYTVGYTHDGIGRITQKVETLNGVTATHDYTYDVRGRLTGAVETGGPNAGSRSYTYDANGNRLTSPGVSTTTYDAQDRMTAYGANTYTYNANGDLVTKTAPGGTTTYEYDAMGNLVSVALPGGGGTVEYVADGLGRRVARKHNSVFDKKWLYEGQLGVVAELDGSGALVSRFVYGTQVNIPDYVVQGGVNYRVITDHLGSLRLVVNSTTGAVVQRMNHDEWGRVTEDFVAGGFTRIPFGYAGGLYDPDTGLVRFGARDYDAETGRWTTKDPIGFAGGLNLYGYVTDPITTNDVAGLRDPTVREIAAYMEESRFLVDYYNTMLSYSTGANFWHGRIVAGPRAIYNQSNTPDPQGICGDQAMWVVQELNAIMRKKNFKYTKVEPVVKGIIGPITHVSVAVVPSWTGKLDEAPGGAYVIDPTSRSVHTLGEWTSQFGWIQWINGPLFTTRTRWAEYER